MPENYVMVCAITIAPLPKSFSFLSGSHWNNIHCAILWYVICVSMHFLTEEKWMYSFTALGTCCLNFSIKYKEAVTIQNNDDQNLEYSGLKCDQAITTKCCTWRVHNLIVIGENVMNRRIAKFHWISNSIEISLDGRAPGWFVVEYVRKPEVLFGEAKKIYDAMWW